MSYVVSSVDYMYFWLSFSVVVVLHYDGLEHYSQHGAILRKICPKEFKYIFWHATNWSIWLMKIKIIFHRGVFDMGDILYLIKVRTWSWFSAINDGSKLLFL